MGVLIASSTALYEFIRISSKAKVNKMTVFFIIRLLLIIKLYIKIRSESSRKMMGNVGVGSFSISEELFAGMP